MWMNVETNTPYIGDMRVGDRAATQSEMEAWQAAQVPVAVCTPWQIRKALIALGLDEQVEAAIAASTDKVLKSGWEFASEFRSDDPFVLTMGAALGKTAEETRDLIQWAGSL